MGAESLFFLPDPDPYLSQIQIQEAQKHTDPDPHHCLVHSSVFPTFVLDEEGMVEGALRQHVHA